jgi:hypothetical protein
MFLRFDRQRVVADVTLTTATARGTSPLCRCMSAPPPPRVLLLNGCQQSSSERPEGPHGSEDDHVVHLCCDDMQTRFGKNPVPGTLAASSESTR